jgi:FkbM family methyltransferase
MNKLTRSRIIITDLLSQIQNNFFTKFRFFISFLLHYSLKSIGITYSLFPSLDVKIYDLKYKTRKNTIDFWAVWKNYEKDITEFLYNLPEGRGVFIDVGAHIGRFSVLMGKKKWKVYAFEPVKSTYNQLITNTKLNDIHTFHGFNYGLGDKPSDRQIYFSDHKTGEASLIHAEDTSNSEEVKIDAFDNLVKENFAGKDVILKIDVEGFETQVMEGIKKMLEEVRPMIILELWEENSKHITDYLYDLGYVKGGAVYWFPPDSIHKNYFHNKYSWNL